MGLAHDATAWVVIILLTFRSRVINGLPALPFPSMYEPMSARPVVGTSPSAIYGAPLAPAPRAEPAAFPPSCLETAPKT